jgi:type VI secretion system secreted protein VgrG
VKLGTASNFAVLAGTTITNAGPSLMNGSLGVSPAAGVTGFPPGRVVNGTIEAGTPAAVAAKRDLDTAYAAAAGAPCNVDKTGQNLGGQTLTPDTYCESIAPTISGTVTLSGSGVFVFQIGSTLVTAPGTTVVLTNGADACNVYWQVGSSATIDTGTAFAGTIMAFTSVTVDDGVTDSGRVQARKGAVTLINDQITVPACTSPPPAPSASTPPSPSSSSAGPPLCRAACPTPTPSPRMAVTISAKPPGLAALTSAPGGGPPSLTNVDMAPPVAAANLAAPILDTHQFPWLWPLLIVVNLALLIVIGVVARRTRGRLPRDEDMRS